MCRDHASSETTKLLEDTHSYFHVGCTPVNYRDCILHCGDAVMLPKTDRYTNTFQRTQVSFVALLAAVQDS